MSEDTVTISKEAYDRLCECEEESRFLDALRAAGVDNWEGYDHAIEILEEWDAEG